jgi:hypothetical protein
MFPSHSVDYASYGGGLETKSFNEFRDSALRRFGRFACIDGPNLQYEINSKYSSWMSFTTHDKFRMFSHSLPIPRRTSSFLHSIGRVLYRRTFPEMIWIAARRVVAIMEAIRERCLSIGNEESNAMSPVGMIVDTTYPVTARTNLPNPRPAFSTYADCDSCEKVIYLNLGKFWNCPSIYTDFKQDEAKLETAESRLERAEKLLRLILAFVPDSIYYPGNRVNAEIADYFREKEKIDGR